MKPITLKFPKLQQSAKVQSVKRWVARALEERRIMQRVRRRDGYRCRMPLCGCHRFGVKVEVSHARHRGMGGNPAGDRTTSAGLVTVCRARHRELSISIDRGTLRWRPLTSRGADGPIAWDVDMGGFRHRLVTEWFEVAREREVQTLEPLTNLQLDILQALADMER